MLFLYNRQKFTVIAFVVSQSVSYSWVILLNVEHNDSYKNIALNTAWYRIRILQPYPFPHHQINWCFCYLYMGSLFFIWYAYYRILWSLNSLNASNRIDGVIVSVLASSVVDRGFSAKHPALKRKSTDWSARIQNNVSEWSDMSTPGLLFQWASTITIQLSLLVKNNADLIIISLKINLFSPWYNWKIAELALNNNRSLNCQLPKWNEKS
jgi:hypothetical protein